MSVEQYTLSKEEGGFRSCEILGQIFFFRKWTWGEKNALSVSCANTNPMTGTVTFDNGRFNTGLIEKTVYKSVEGKPTVMTSAEVENLDSQVGDRLFRITQKINLVQTVESINL